MAALKFWFGTSLAYKVLDIITTMYLVYTRGLNAESNPFARDMLLAYGTTPGLLLNGAIVGMLLYVLYKHRRTKLLMVSTFMMMLVTAINTMTVLMC